MYTRNRDTMHSRNRDRHDRRIWRLAMTQSTTSRASVALACIISSGIGTAPLAAQRAAADLCAPSGKSRPLAGLQEASGAALSRRAPGVLWSHNDSGQPIVHAVDVATGTERGRVRISNATVEDWEDVSVGPCPGGSCLYI